VPRRTAKDAWSSHGREDAAELMAG
jgi:hypothetical protein